MKVRAEDIYSNLSKVLDPELGIDIVSLGLIYDVTVAEVQGESGQEPFVHVLLTLTTPGCPLAGMFDTLIKDAVIGLPGITSGAQIEIELTFDPPWVPDMMSPEAKAELGFD